MEQVIAHELLRIGAVFLRPEEPFTWASGIKSPIYCDNRLVLSDPTARKVVEAGIAKTIQQEYPGCRMLMGTATAGIAHAAIAASLLDLPMGYVRSSAKGHGRENRIEGRLEPGCPVVVVEDLISTGGSVIEVVEALREAGAEVLGIVSIFTYNIARGLQRLSDASVRNCSLCNLDALVDVAVAESYITPDQKQEVLNFRNSL